jgi:hypothetical protein
LRPDLSTNPNVTSISRPIICDTMLSLVVGSRRVEAKEGMGCIDFSLLVRISRLDGGWAESVAYTSTIASA